MTNSKHTKRALLSSVIALILCCSMLVGTTFAWFTDSVESVNNIITAGNLDIEVTNAKGDISGQATLFQDILWEPGVVAYENLTVKNVGTLALKYAMYINFEGQNFVIEADGTQTNYGLASKLEVAIVPGGVASDARADVIAAGTQYGWTALENLSKPGVLYPNDNKDGYATAETFGIVIRWNPSADDNNWNVQNGKTTTDGKPLHIDLGVNVFATQLTYEKDSFDHLYDENAKFDILPQASVSNKNPEGLETIIYDVNTGSFDMNTIVILNLDTAYAFKGESPETAAQNKYADWFVDFFVAVDKDPKAGMMLSGQYDSFFDKWVAFEVPADAIKANTFYPLLGSVTGGGVSNWTYVDICQGVGTFNCGAVDTQGLNAGTTLTVQLRLINPENTDETIVARETKYTFTKEVADNAALQDAFANGLTGVNLADGNYTLPSVSNNKVTINGTEDTVITVDKPAFHGSDVTLNGVTVKGSGYSTGIQHVNTVTYNDATIVGEMCLYGEKVVFNNCTFELNGQYIWTYGAKEVEFNNCTFNTTGKAILVYNEGAGASKVTVKGCTFNATAGAKAGAIANQNCAAIEIDNHQNSGVGAAHVVITENNTVNSNFSGEWRIKNFVAGNPITVNGSEYTQIAIDGNLMTIDANKNVTVN